MFTNEIEDGREAPVKPNKLLIIKQFQTKQLENQAEGENLSDYLLEIQKIFILLNNS